MIYPEKCVLSDKKENYCEFAQNIRGETHCALVLEWWHDTRVSQLDKCFLKIKNRAKLSWRNRQIKKQKLPKMSKACLEFSKNSFDINKISSDYRNLMLEIISGVKYSKNWK